MHQLLAIMLLTHRSDTASLHRSGRNYWCSDKTEIPINVEKNTYLTVYEAWGEKEPLRRHQPLQITEGNLEPAEAR